MSPAPVDRREALVAELAANLNELQAAQANEKRSRRQAEIHLATIEELRARRHHLVEQLRAVDPHAHIEGSSPPTPAPTPRRAVRDIEADLTNAQERLDGAVMAESLQGGRNGTGALREYWRGIVDRLQSELSTARERH